MDDALFWSWLNEGIGNGFCAEPCCYYHDVPDHTDEEWQEVEEDGETCLPIVRLHQFGLSQGLSTVPEPADTTNTVHYLPQSEHGKESPLTGHNRVDSPRP
jgi:hypothetical protein